MLEAHYLNKIYLLQDKVLNLLSSAKLKHYLTGETVLSRAFFNHRYSDDLDFFLNDDGQFEDESDRAISLLSAQFNVHVENKQIGYRRIFISTTNDGVNLKLDFVNDIAYHTGNFESGSLYYKIDNVLNILSNKISALGRKNAKDIADIIWICHHISFSWPFIIEDAGKKDNWVNEVDVLTEIKTFSYT